MYNRLKDKVAIITGSARGMGFAIAKAIYDEGAKVVIVDIDAEGVEAAARSLDSDENRVWGRCVDVTNKTQINELVRKLSPNGAVSISW